MGAGRAPDSSQLSGVGFAVVAVAPAEVATALFAGAVDAALAFGLGFGFVAVGAEVLQVVEGVGATFGDVGDVVEFQGDDDGSVGGPDATAL